MLMPGGASTSRAAGEASLQGYVTCHTNANSVDSLLILPPVRGPGTAAGCLADAGDVNCDAAVNSVDSLRILRYVAGLSNTTPDGCIAIGEPLAPPPTSEALIAQAPGRRQHHVRGVLLCTAPCPLRPPDLPDEFRSPVPNMHAAVDLFGEIDQKKPVNPCAPADLGACSASARRPGEHLQQPARPHRRRRSLCRANVG